MVGVASIDFAIRNLSRGHSNLGILSMQASALMLDITKNASLMTGNLTKVGYDDNHGAGGFRRYCFREDINAAGTVNNTPSDYNDDHWICYRQDTGGSPVYKDNCASVAACLAAAPAQALGFTSPDGLAINFSPDNAMPPQNLAIDIKITARYIPSANVSSQNPEIILTSKVHPTAQSY